MRAKPPGRVTWRGIGLRYFLGAHRPDDLKPNEVDRFFDAIARIRDGQGPHGRKLKLTEPQELWSASNNRRNQA